MLALTDSCVSCYHSGYVASVELCGWIQAIDDIYVFFVILLVSHYDVNIGIIMTSLRVRCVHRPAGPSSNETSRSTVRITGTRYLELTEGQSGAALAA